MSLAVKEGGMCPCGHSSQTHQTETEVASFSGIFNPALAGRIETYTWIVCDHIDEQGEPCSAMRHEWPANSPLNPKEDT